MKTIAKKFKDIKLRNKIMIIFICMGTIPILLLGMYAYIQERDMMIDKEKANIKDSLSQGVSQFNSQIMIYDNLSDYLAFDKPISNAFTAHYESKYDMYMQYITNIDPVLSSLQYFNPNVRQLTIYVDEDIVRHNNSIAPISELENVDVSSVENDIMWVTDDKNRQAYSVRKMPLMQQNGKLGILYLLVDYSDLFAGFESMFQDEYGIFIVNRKKEVVFQTSHFDENHKKDISVQKILDAKRQIDSGGYSDYMVVSETTAVDGWTAYLYRSASLVDESTNVLLYVFGGIMFVCILMCIAAIKVLNLFVIKDIEQLNANMALVKEGNLEVTVESDAKDEIGGLIRSYASMLSEIKRLIHEVYESKLAQKKYEMTALQAQINPHFLYNSLSLINWLALEAGHEEISKLTLALSSFYRTSLNRGSNILTIEREIENMKSYLEIQMCMHEDEFDVIMDIDDSILEYETLNLLLQPLVENAIEHGVSLKEDGRGFIKIIGRKDDEKKLIYLIVEDNGIGIEPNVLASILEFKTRGYGVRNVNQRIKLYYGDAYSLKIMSTVGQGTICTITIPMKEFKAAFTKE